jgi:LysR family cyn operon transcriptional activator
VGNVPMAGEFIQDFVLINPIDRIYDGRMELRHLRYFLAVAERLHFTRAAEALHVSQPTLSHQIRQLEEELGQPLFVRLGRQVRLTEAGAAFQRYARAAVEEVEAGQTAIRQLEDLVRGRVRVGAIQSFNAALLPLVVAAFLKRYPGIRVEIEEASAGVIEAKLLAGDYDLGFAFAPPERPEIMAEDVFEERIGFIVASGHPLADRREISFAEASHVPLAMLSPAFSTRRMIDTWFAAADATPRIAFETNSIPAILAAVRQGELATIQALDWLPIGEHFAAVPLIDPKPTRRCGILWVRGRWRTAAARAFAAELRRALQQIPARSSWEGAPSI